MQFRNNLSKANEQIREIKWTYANLQTGKEKDTLKQLVIKTYSYKRQNSG